MRHCGWTPRQGHACLTYRGSIFIIGGFDESGYCNDMFRLKVGAGEEFNLYLLLCYNCSLFLKIIWSGVDWIGLDRIGLDWIGLDYFVWFCIMLSKYDIR